MKVTKEDLTSEEISDIENNIISQVRALLYAELIGFDEDIVQHVREKLIKSLST